MTIDEMIEVLTAYKNGDTIQARSRRYPYSDRWDDVELTFSHEFSFDTYDYRIKPKLRTIYVGFDECGVIISTTMSEPKTKDPGINYIKFVEQIDEHDE